MRRAAWTDCGLEELSGKGAEKVTVQAAEWMPGLLENGPDIGCREESAWMYRVM